MTTQAQQTPIRILLVNGAEPMKKPAKKTAKKAAKKNPATKKRASSRHAKHNPKPKHRRHARRNPATTGKLGAFGLGAVAGVASELVDYGTDQIGKSPMVQGAVSVGAHAALAVGGSFLDTRLAAGLTACAVKTASQRVRTAMALSAAKKKTDTKAGAGDTKTAADTGATTSPAAADTGATTSALGAVSVRRGALPPATNLAQLRSVVKARSVNA